MSDFYNSGKYFQVKSMDAWWMNTHSLASGIINLCTIMILYRKIGLDRQTVLDM